MLIDVRTEGEYENGHHKDAVNIPLEEMVNKPLDFSLDEEIILYCFSGARAEVAQLFLKGKGFTNVSLLNGTGAYNG